MQAINTLKKFVPKSVKKNLKLIWESNLAHTIRFDVNYHLLKRTPIVVYQMGKVGSRSVELSLRQYGFLVYHSHSMIPAILNKSISELDPQFTRGLRHFLWIHDHIATKNRRMVKYITLVRDPMAYNVASFFENLHPYTNVAHAHEKFALDELLELFLSKFNYTDRALEWFDKNMKVVPGIDVYKYVFPKEIGYTIIREGNNELLIIKLETDDHTKEKALAEYLEMDEFKLSNTNIGDKKNYAEKYNAFKNTVRIPPKDIERSCNSRFVQHFYTSDEIAAMRDQWLRN